VTASRMQAIGHVASVLDAFCQGGFMDRKIVRIVDYRWKKQPVSSEYEMPLMMRCYELEDGRLLRVDSLEEWTPTEDYEFIGEVPS
jgi:hypothetical protein